MEKYSLPILGVSPLMEASAMARTTPRPAPTETQLLPPLQRYCPPCGETMGAAYPNYRTFTTLEAVLALTLHMRRCLNRSCPPFRPPYRPEPAGRLALPQPACGLDVIAMLGQWRYAVLWFNRNGHREKSDMMISGGVP